MLNLLTLCLLVYEFDCMLTNSANSLDPDQARHDVEPDLDPNCLIHWWYSLINNYFFLWGGGGRFDKNLQMKQNANLLSMQRVKRGVLF